MNKTLLSLILAALIAAPLTVFGNVASVQAATINTAIRGESQQTVYWYANDGKRYVFPNAATYFTWFASFDNVQNISDSELFAIPLGGNVTYRPGAKLVKINTDPKVYAVARGGVLRHVTSESLANQLYGFDWSSKVQDIAVEYFANYNVGSPIYNVSDFNVSNEYNGVFSPSDSLRIQGQGSAGQSGSLTLNADRTSITSGQAVYLTGTYFGTLPSGGYLEIKDVRNSNTIKTCYNTSTCTVTVYPTVDSSQNSVQYYIVAKNSNGTHIGTQYGQVIYTNGSSQNGSLTMNTDRTNITSGQAVYLTSDYNANLPSGGRIEIKEVRTNTIVKTCYNSSSCNVTVYPYQSGYSSTQYVSTVFNNSGVQIATQYSSTIYFSGSSNQIGTLTLSSDRTSITSGQAVTIQSLYNQSLPSGFYQVITRVNGATATTIKTCYVGSCSITEYPTETQTYNAYAYNTNGSVATWANAITVVVSGTSNGTSNDGTNFINGLTLQSDRTSAANGDMVKLTANAYNNGNWSYVGNRLEIRDVRTGAIVKTCHDQSWCVVDVSVQGNNGTAQYEARIYDRNGNFIMSQFGPVIYVSGTTSNNGGCNNGFPYGDTTCTSPTLTANTTSIRPGEAVQLRAGFFNYSVLRNGRIEIIDTRTQTIIKTCQGTTVCDVTVYPYRNNSESSVQYSARSIYLGDGSTNATVYGPVIYFSGTTDTGSVGTVAQIANTDIHIAPTYNVRAGGSVYLTASFTNLPFASSETVIRLYTEQSSTPVGTCSGSVSCSVPYTIPTSGVNTRVYGVASNSSLTNTRETARIPLYAF